MVDTFKNLFTFGANKKSGMKNIFLTLFLLVSLSTISYAQQQVDFDDLKNGNTSMDNTGSSKKWIKDLDAAKDIQLAKAILSKELIKMTKSKHWLSLSANGEITKEISFQTSKKMHLVKVIDHLKEAGFVLSNTKTTIDSNTYVYTKGELTIEVLALQTESTATTVYLLTLI